MAEATVLDVIEEIQDVLDSNISDPNPTRDSNTRWIYNLPVQFDISKYPRIHIHNVSNTQEGLSIGSTERWIENRIQVSIFHGTGQGNKIDIDNDGELERPTRIVDTLNKDVRTEINDNQSTWRALGDGDNVFSVLTEEEQRLQDEQNQVLQHNIDAIIKMKR